MYFLYGLLAVICIACMLRLLYQVVGKLEYKEELADQNRGFSRVINGEIWTTSDSVKICDDIDGPNISLWVTNKGQFFNLIIRADNHIVPITNDYAYDELAANCPADSILGYVEMYFPELKKA